ncbi:MAG: hypothetical protein M3Z10_00275 [Gemmatimonadota bacterium]|nr:hypothetical protein [Gemmatimonadota bacterium]
MLSRLMETLMKHIKKDSTTAQDQTKAGKRDAQSGKFRPQDRNMASKESVTQSANKIMKEHSKALKWLADK